MKEIFSYYDLLKQSGLFDPEYYLANNPAVAAQNIDPLLHYIEFGAVAGRDPHADFDTAFYLEQCRQHGEQPENPLLHFVMTGAQRGLRPFRSAAVSQAYSAAITTLPHPLPHGEARHPPDPALFAMPPDMRLYIDTPLIQLGVAMAPAQGTMTILGWALARRGIASMEATFDGHGSVEVHRGLRRRDVAQAYPDWPDGLLSGFEISIPRRRLTEGLHPVTLKFCDKAGQTGQYEFQIKVERTSEGTGEPQLRQKIPQAESDMQFRLLENLKWHPTFVVAMPVPKDSEDIERGRITLASLRRQAYPAWRLLLLPPVPGRQRQKLPAWCEDARNDVPGRVSWAQYRGAGPLAELVGIPAEAGSSAYFSLIRPGDVLGCDALLEFAVETASDPATDFWYCDERRLDHGAHAVAPYLKPQWSPDLLRSTNYIGRLWFARLELLAQTSATVEELKEFGEYDLVLRCTETASSVRHIPVLLCERSTAEIEPAAMEIRALQRANERRSEVADVTHGHLPGTYRARRRITAPGRVSIIIPTCGTNDLIKTCIDSIRSCSTYRDFEVICIDNIAVRNTRLKRWLAVNADKVIADPGPFNWSRFNNLAAKHSQSDYLLFLNDDIEVAQPDWLEGLLEHAQRSEVGAVGPRLLYPHGSVQHAGLFLVPGARARHAFRHLSKDDPGPFGLALTQRNVIGVTGACLMTRRSTFAAIGGFDEAHEIINNDLDYCLRLWQQGYQNVFTPYTTLIHHEKASRARLADRYDSSSFDRRWKEIFLAGDPYFHPGLSIEHDDFSIEPEPVRRIHVGHPLFAPAEIRKILAVKLDHVGDCIAALPALRRLKERFPRAGLHLLVSSSNSKLMAAQPYIDQVVEFDFFHIRSSAGKRDISPAMLQHLRDQLGSRDLDLAIDLRKHPETRPILLETGARYLAGFDYRHQFPWLDVALEWEGDRQSVPKRRHISDDLLLLVDAVCAACTGEREVMEPAWQNPSGSRPVVCLHPGGGNPTKQWPAAYFASLMNLLIKNEDAEILLIGDENDREIARQILRQVDRPKAVRNLVSRLALPDLPPLLAGCSLFVGNDSGPKHIAAGLGVPTVGIHSGVVDAAEWGPLGPRAVAIRREVSCSPCYLEKVEECHRSMACLQGIEPWEVYKLCRKLLGFAQSGLQE